MRFIKQEKPLYVSKWKVTMTEREFCALALTDCYLFRGSLATEQAPLLPIYK